MSPHSPAGPPVVLLLEDDYLIASDVEDSLRDAGFNVVAFHTYRKANDWLLEHRPDVAVIDIKLADGTCSHIAAGLLAKAVPFVVHSGTQKEPGAYDPVFDHGLWLPKPTLSTTVAQAVHDLLADAVIGTTP